MLCLRESSRIAVLTTLAALSLPPVAAQPDREELVDLAKVNPRIVVELKYATPDNFLKKPLYTDSRCLILPTVGEKLDKAQKILERDGLGLKVYDCFRPVEVQKKMWEVLPDARYVANPYAGGSMHNRGVAVDLTLVDSAGNELEMPTPFDTFTERAHLFSPEPEVGQRVNRALLRQVMEEAGLVPLPTEWWHYQLPEGEKYPILAAGIPASWNSIIATVSRQAPEARQLLLAVSPRPESQTVQVGLVQREGKSWRLVTGPFEGVVGRKGFAPPGRKREGDGKSPTGVFPLNYAFGYQSKVESKLPYRQMTDDDYWVDDPASPNYNRLVHGKPTVSAESMRRDDDAYKYGVVIEYNTDPVVPGQGSAIFLHVWNGPGRPTAGCLAVPQETMVELLRKLDPQKGPVVAMGVEEDLRSLP